MSALKIPGGNRRIRFGKHEGKTFANVYNKHRYYMLLVLCLEAASGPMLDLQRYFASREDRPPPTPRPESKPMFIGLDIWYQVMNIEEPMTTEVGVTEVPMTSKRPMTARSYSQGTMRTP